MRRENYIAVEQAAFVLAHSLGISLIEFRCRAEAGAYGPCRRRRRGKFLLVRTVEEVTGMPVEPPPSKASRHRRRRQQLHTFKETSK
jgi:hypothetical protein